MAAACCWPARTRHSTPARDGCSPFVQLLDALSSIDGLDRIRFTSPHPGGYGDDVVAAYARLPKLCASAHLPVQSGSNRILALMHRGYTRERFLTLADKLRRARPEIGLTTDFIVGFPGETEVDFPDSLDFVREIGFTRLHVFSYSSRPGTAAAKMPGHLPKAVKKERAHRMIALGQELSLAFHRRYEAQTRPVLWENAIGADNDGLHWAGYTDNYIRVLAHGPADLFNRITLTQLVNAQPDGVSGRIVERRSNK